MNLYLMRHADAVDIGEKGVQRDDDRMLSEKGLRQISRVAEFMQAQGIRLDAVVSSPFLRARQTAERLAGILAPDVAVTIIPEMEPGVTPEAFLHALVSCRSNSLLAVGHMPDLAYLSGLLVAGTGRPSLDFKKAAVAAFDVDDGLMKPGNAILQWFVRPRLLNPAPQSPPTSQGLQLGV